MYSFFFFFLTYPRVNLSKTITDWLSSLENKRYYEKRLKMAVCFFLHTIEVNGVQNCLVKEYLFFISSVEHKRKYLKVIKVLKTWGWVNETKFSFFGCTMPSCVNCGYVLNSILLSWQCCYCQLKLLKVVFVNWNKEEKCNINIRWKTRTHKNLKKQREQRFCPCQLTKKILKIKV